MITPSQEQALPSSARPSPAAIAVAAITIAGATVLAYLNTFSVPLLFDDHDAIIGNLSLREIWPPWLALSPPPDGSTTAGRPFLNLTLALNYAVGGTAVHGYHVVNLALHILSGLTLFGVLRRTLTRPLLRGRFGEIALPLAWATTLLWVLHPLQTESVTYIIQRAECLVGLLFLLTLYGFIRSVETPRALRWQVLAVTACALGMASKEVMVSAPLIVWCYDRTFVCGGFGAALRQRPRFYAVLGATWLLLGFLIATMGGSRGVSAGFSQGMSPWAYALAQCEAVPRYLRLAGWPHPLVFDYGIVLPPLGQVLPQAVLLALLAGGGLYAFVRGTALGFAAVFFFVVLAPSSSVMPITTQTMAEHRMYLPLAAVLAVLVAGVVTLAGRPGLIAAFVTAAGFGFLTHERNHDYRSEAAIWHDTTVKWPGNPRAFDNYALALVARGELAAAISALEQAQRLNPNSAHTQEVLASVLFRLERFDEARAHYQVAVRLDPRSAIGHGGLGSVAYRVGDYVGAVRSLEEAVRLDPQNAGYRRNYAAVLFWLGRADESIAAFRTALGFAPADAEIHADLGGVALLLGQYPLAITHSTEALRLNPDHARARNNLAAAEAAAAAPKVR